MIQPEINEFSSGDELADRLSEDVARSLAIGIESHKTATLVVSGGRTPIQFLEALSEKQIHWGAVQVFLADERWVPVDNDRSNAKFVTRHLLREAASDARLHPLHTEEFTVEQAANGFQQQLASSQAPFDVVVLGMGTDGHTASLFPDAPGLKQALAADAPEAVVMAPASQPERRISMTPIALTNTRFLALHIEGAEKRRVYERALENGPAYELPIRAILRNDFVAPQVYWCP